MGTPPQQGGTTTVVVTGRMQQGTQAPPEDTVEDIIPPEKSIRNPFNGVSVFRSPNLPQNNIPVTGAIALGFMLDPPRPNDPASGTYVFAFAYQGTDSTTTTLGQDATTFHAGLGLNSIPNLRNSVLFAQIRP